MSSIVTKTERPVSLGRLTAQTMSIIFYAILSLSNCDVNRFFSKPSAHNPAQDFLLYLFFQREDSNYELFHYIPNPNPGLGEIRPDSLRFRHPETMVTKKNKSLIFIHGWNFKERNSDPPADFAYKVAQIKDTWMGAIHFIDTTPDKWRNEYDIYFYTYRTSNPIDENGRKFWAEIQKYFTDDQQLVIVAHSMGGLVSRQAMVLAGSDSRRIDGLVSLGTPYFGSPFAIPQFTAHNPVLAELIGFYTATDGGRNLIHSNAFPGQLQISGGNNPYLEELSRENPAIDQKTVAYYGNLTDCNLADLVVFRTSCSILKNRDPALSENDAIVTRNSAILGGRARENWTKENYDHSMVSFRFVNRDAAKPYFEEVMNRIAQIPW